MYKTQAEADQRIAELCKSDGALVEEESYVALYNSKKDAFVIYPKVATLELKAMRTGVYAGKTAAVFEDAFAELISAKTAVKRFVMDNICEFWSDPVYHNEYAKLDWHKEKPHMFLGKIALARALRHAFPDLLADDPTVSSISHEEIRCELNFGKGADVKAPKESAKIDAKVPEADDVHSMVQNIFKLSKAEGLIG